MIHEDIRSGTYLFFSQAIGNNNNGDSVFCHLPKSYHAVKDFNYGLRLSARLVARDNIGYPGCTHLDSLSSVYIAVLNAATLEPIAAGLREWSACLHFY